MRALSLAVVGAAHPNKRGPTRRYGIELCQPGDLILLVPEPKNPADEHAVAVFGHDVQLGYLQSERAALISRILASGREASAIFQEKTQYGCAIRVAFDGEDPVLPRARAEQAAHGSDGFWPDEIYPDD